MSTYSLYQEPIYWRAHLSSFSVYVILRYGQIHEIEYFKSKTKKLEKNSNKSKIFNLDMDLKSEIEHKISPFTIKFIQPQEYGY